MIISCCWFNVCSVLWWQLLSLSLSLECRWPGTARGRARQALEVRFLICLCTNYTPHDYGWQTSKWEQSVSLNSIKLGSCFTGRGLERTTSFCPTSGNLQAMFSTVVSEVIFSAVLEFEFCSVKIHQYSGSFLQCLLSRQARLQVSDQITLIWHTPYNKCM